MSNLIPGSNPAGSIQPSALFTLLEKHLREWLGYEEPSLVKIIKASSQSPSLHPHFAATAENCRPFMDSILPPHVLKSA
jgi:hypothetical protein